MKPATVFIVDDDAAVRHALGMLMYSADLPFRLFESAHDFLEKYEPEEPGCLLLDVRMPGMTGLELQEVLAERSVVLPVIILTGHADVPMSVRAMKRGAFDFLEKPFSDEELLGLIRRAITLDASRRVEMVEYKHVHERIGKLSEGELQVLSGMVEGKPYKVIARDLQISYKTVEARRARIMRKMRIESLAELVRKVTAYPNWRRLIPPAPPRVGT